MITTFQSCARSEISVIPKNWKTRKASVKKEWMIFYRFYDPAFKSDKARWGKLFFIRGMNDCLDLSQRQEVTAGLIKNEAILLDVQSFNPGIDLASAGAGHTNTTTTINHYAVGHQSRKLNLLKSKKVGFAESHG